MSKTVTKKKMLSTEDELTKTNERITGKYCNCNSYSMRQNSAAMYQAVLRIKVGCIVITRKTWNVLAIISQPSS